MFSVTNPFHLLALAVQLGKEFERTAWYRAEEIKKIKKKQCKRQAMDRSKQKNA